MSAPDSSTVVQIGEWMVHPALDSISRGTETQKLEPRAMRLLMCLASAAGEVVSIDRLLTEVWAGVVVGPASVYEAVSQLRKILGDVDAQPSYIVTVPRKGYRLIAPVQRGSAGAEAPPAKDAGRKVVLSPRVWALAGAFVVLASIAAYFWVDKVKLSKHEKSVAAVVVSDKSIAVLPFTDMSEQKDQEYFGDGMAEEIIDLLVKIPELKVIARTSSFYFKGKQVTLQEIAKSLGVAHVLEGSVRRVGNTVRVTAHLVRTSSGDDLWSQTYDRDVTDIFKVQDEIAAAVVGNLKLKVLSGQEFQSADRNANPEAYFHFLLGRQLFNRSDPDDFRRAVVAYQKAIALDPNYAAAYAGLAFAEAYVADYTGDAEGLKRAETAAEKAIPLAPEEADGYAARGYLRLIYRQDWAGAQTDLRRALAINPSDSTVQRRHGDLLESLGRLPEAIAAVRKAIELDPLSSLAWHTLGLQLIFSQDYPAAHEALRRALEIQPDSVVALNALGILQLLEGSAAEALLTFRKNRFDGFRLTGVAMAEQTLGHVEESQQALSELIGKHAQSGAYQIAEVFGWRGEKDKAFEWLERAYRQRDGGLSNVKVDPLFASLRSDPRFNALLRKMNLPEG
jgi:TolB-like protein/DNA-binding winged helix-turn-helix (wHTH) protein/Flp pilus assembly protein TadD